MTMDTLKQNATELYRSVSASLRDKVSDSGNAQYAAGFFGAIVGGHGNGLIAMALTAPFAGYAEYRSIKSGVDLVRKVQAEMPEYASEVKNALWKVHGLNFVAGTVLYETVRQAVEGNWGWAAANVGIMVYAGLMKNKVASDLERDINMFNSPDAVALRKSVAAQRKRAGNTG